MIFTTTITPLLVLAALAGTALADLKKTYGGFLSMCQKDTVRLCSSLPDIIKGQQFLCASCYDDNIKALNPAFSSRLDLNRCLANKAGDMVFQNNGNLSLNGCTNCHGKFIKEIEFKDDEFTFTLECDCRNDSGGSDVVPIENAVVNLNQGIHVHNGQLTCFESEGSQIPTPKAIKRRSISSAKMIRPVTQDAEAEVVEAVAGMGIFQTMDRIAKVSGH